MTQCFVTGRLAVPSNSITKKAASYHVHQSWTTPKSGSEEICHSHIVLMRLDVTDEERRARPMGKRRTRMRVPQDITRIDKTTKDESAQQDFLQSPIVEF